MKKIILSALTVCCATFTAVHANSTHESFSIAIVNEGDETAIKPEELPKAVKSTLLSDNYKEWTVATASLVKGEKEYYKIELSKGSEKKTIKLNSDGHEISEKKEMKTAEYKDPKGVQKETK